MVIPLVLASVPNGPTAARSAAGFLLPNTVARPPAYNLGGYFCNLTRKCLQDMRRPLVIVSQKRGLRFPPPSLSLSPSLPLSSVRGNDPFHPHPLTSSRLAGALKRGTDKLLGAGSSAPPGPGGTGVCTGGRLFCSTCVMAAPTKPFL